MAKRFFIVLILLSIIAIDPSIFASERVFLISENKVTIFDWSTRKASRVIRVKGEALAVVEGQDPNFAFVLSRGRVNDHLPTGPSYISYIDLRKGRIQKNIAIGFGLKDYYYDETQDKLFLLTGAIGPFPNTRAKLGLYVFDLQTKQVEKILPLTCNPVAKAISPDKKYLAIISAGIIHKDHRSASSPALQIYDLAKKELIAEQSLPLYPAEIVFSKDNTKIYILTAGYPNKLPPDYPQLGQKGTTQATISVWDFNTMQLSGPFEIGTGARKMGLLADNTGVCMLSDDEQKPVVIFCSPTLLVRKLNCEKQPSSLISTDKGKYVYLISQDSVEVINSNTRLVIKSIPFMGKVEKLTLGVIDGGKSFLFERYLNRIRIHDPILNRVEIMSLDKTKDFLGFLKTKNVSLPRGEVHVLGNKMYLLPAKEPYVLVYDLDSMQIMKKIPTQIKDRRGHSINIYPDVLVPSPDGTKLFACELLDSFGVVPINTQLDEVSPGCGNSFNRIFVKVSYGRGIPSNPVTINSKPELHIAGPVLDSENQVLYSVCNDFFEYFDLTTWKSNSKRIKMEVSYIWAGNKCYPVEVAR